MGRDLLVVHPRSSVVHSGMTTSLPRIKVTVTEPVAKALEVADETWPGLQRSQQVARLLSEGARSLASAQKLSKEKRREVLEATRGMVAYQDGYLDQLRGEWPE